MEQDGGGPIPSASLGPGAVPADELPALWRQSISPFFDAQPIAKPTHLQTLPDIREFHLEKMLFVDSAFPGQIFTRDKAWMQTHDDADHLLLQLFVTGESVASNGWHEYVERPGNIFAMNLAYEVRAQSTDARVMTLVLPRGLVAEELPHLAAARGALFAPGSAGARIFVDHMLSLGRSLPQGRSSEIPGIVRSTIGLLDALAVHKDGPSSLVHDATFQAACRHIDRHIDDPGLGVKLLCTYLHCSRATLFRLFKPHGGVREYIQRRRLIACFKALNAAKNQHRRIIDVALDFGFTSPSHFSHLFREHFGMAPRDARETQLDRVLGASPAADDGTANDDAQRMWLWAKTLTG